MTMQQLNTATQALTAAANAYHGKMQEIEVRVQQALAQVPQATRTIYVNQATGNNTAAGTENNPVADIAEAIARTPSGGLLIVRLQGDYHVQGTLHSRNIAVDVRGVRDSLGVPPRLTFDWVPSTGEPGTIERMAGFQPWGRADFQFHTLRIELPADPAVPFASSSKLAVVAGDAGAVSAVVAARFAAVDFSLAAGSTEATLMGRAVSFISVNFQSCTFPSSGFAGRVVRDRGGEGINPDTVSRFVVTNLSWI